MSAAARRAIEVLTAEEYAAVLKVKRDTFYRWLRRGLLPTPIRIGGPTSHPRWRLADVEADLARRSAAAAQPSTTVGAGR